MCNCSSSAVQGSHTWRAGRGIVVAATNLTGNEIRSSSPSNESVCLQNGPLTHVTITHCRVYYSPSRRRGDCCEDMFIIMCNGRRLRNPLINNRTRHTNKQECHANRSRVKLYRRRRRNEKETRAFLFNWILLHSKDKSSDSVGRRAEERKNMVDIVGYGRVQVKGNISQTLCRVAQALCNKDNCFRTQVGDTRVNVRSIRGYCDANSTVQEDAIILARWDCSRWLILGCNRRCGQIYLCFWCPHR